MKRHIVFLILIVCLFLPSVVHAVEGLPGSAWGDLYWDIPKSGDSNVILEGWIRQGIAWEKWQKETTSFQITTYLTARYKWDNKKLDWNNYFGPGAGISIDMHRPSGPLVSWGLEHFYQMNYRSGDNEQKSALYMNWYHWWDFDNKKYPGATWGDFRWEIPNTGNNNVILEAWIRQGIVIKRWDDGRNNFFLNPYLKFRCKWDNKKLDWNNYFGPGVGIALDMESAKGPLMSWGIEYNRENNFRSGGHAQRVDVFMRWYFGWDLMKKGPSQ